MKKLGLVRSLAALVAVAMLMVPSLVTAATYNLESDWSSTLNPNGTWAFWQGGTVLPPQTGGFAATQIGASNYFAPSPNSGYFLPIWWQEGSSPILGLATGIVYTHSVDSANGAPALGQSAVTWTSPVAGTIDVSLTIWYAQSGVQRSDDFSLYLGRIFRRCPKRNPAHERYRELQHPVLRPSACVHLHRQRLDRPSERRPVARGLPDPW